MNGPSEPMQYYSAPAGFNSVAAPPTFELIPHRVFVGGFVPATNEEDLRKHFEQFYRIREVKVIRDQNGVSKGYGFVTFDTQEEADAVRSMSAERLEFKGRRLNLGPALRRMVPRFSTEYAMATPSGQLVPSPTVPYATYAFPAQPTSPVATQPSYVLMSPPVSSAPASFLLSPSESVEVAAAPSNQSSQHHLGSMYSPSPFFMPSSPMFGSVDLSRSLSSYGRPQLPPLMSPQAFYQPAADFAAFHMATNGGYMCTPPREPPAPPATPIYSALHEAATAAFQLTSSPSTPIQLHPFSLQQPPHHAHHGGVRDIKRAYSVEKRNSEEKMAMTSTAGTAFTPTSAAALTAQLQSIQLASAAGDAKSGTAF